MTDHHLTIQHGKYSADIVVSGSWSLYHLAEFINKTIGFYFDHAFEFCDNIDDPLNSKERYTLFADMGDDPDFKDPGVKNTLVSAVFTPKRKMFYFFDYGDDWCFLVTCKKVTEAVGKRRLRVVIAEKGVPPVQYEYPDDEG